jgi:predicted metal-binding membrane protein
MWVFKTSREPPFFAYGDDFSTFLVPSATSTVNAGATSRASLQAVVRKRLVGCAALTMMERADTKVNGDRLVVFCALMLICVLAWAYVLYMGWGMAHMDVGAAMAVMPRMISWGPLDLVFVLAMWAIMMVAMMLPSATPMILVFSAISKQLKSARTFTDVAAFVAGYIAMWTAFSVLATLAQWGLLEARLVSPLMVASSPMLSGGVLVATGVFQFTPLKERCLSKCRKPLAFIAAHWRKGTGGAFIMGTRHGLYCVGCCWLLMLLLFVLGVMNLLWIALLAAFVLLEKMLPNVQWFSRLSGVVFIGWGIWLLARLSSP